MHITNKKLYALILADKFDWTYNGIQSAEKNIGL